MVWQVFPGSRKVLKEFLMEMEMKECAVLTPANGVPVDVNRDRIPGRPVHGNGPAIAGAFTITGDISQYTPDGSFAIPATTSAKSKADRRDHRRHDMETQDLVVDRWDGSRRSGMRLGTIVDLSASGARIRISQANVKPGAQIHVRLELPAFAGISPFIHARGKGLTPTNEWVGWMSVDRVVRIKKDEYEVAGRLIDMDEIDRGMLGLYLSAQPLAISGIKSNQEWFC
jgi:hypothetical protein